MSLERDSDAQGVLRTIDIPVDIQQFPRLLLLIYPALPLLSQLSVLNARDIQPVCHRRHQCAGRIFVRYR